ncbi:patatin-like phospholipase family protein [Maribellus sp. YY47]|uniref:patatin-like phospholipase family protein n=1 Tax=Maribellus sp. YY47 TaxID=2929486 RepID=UPI0020007DC2|nr:patatin-like phospholipase family protein [Maribellus sp. YY47]MCK3683255.1 patatin-like phospholipase family protein [Maribellus sp. YY47]
MTKKIALVLSGGGARGLAHIGVIEELLKRDYEITSIAGTSMGALVAGVYAQGKLSEFRDWVTALDQFEVFKLVDFTFSAAGLVKGERVLNTIKEFIPDTRIEDLPIPYSATAVDIIQHREIVFRSGMLFDAIRASIAIPTVFTPIEKDGMILVDGGVMNNVPISNVERTKGDLLVAVHVNANIPVVSPVLSKKETKKKEENHSKWLNRFAEFLSHSKEKEHSLGYLSLIDNTLTTGMLRLAQLAIENGKPDILVEISRDTCGTYDFYKATEVIETGRLAARQVLDQQ